MILSASRKLGNYEIVRKLGRGGMADVYLAHDAETNRDVALKLVEHATDSDTCDVIEAERRGARLQQQLAAIDAHVVGVYEFGDLESFFFVAMEYVDGQDLAELMRGRRLEPEFATDVAIAVAETLHHAHNLETFSNGRSFQGIVHGDIKPKNIRIDSHANVRVLDFGIAKALSLSRRLTRNEFGSVPYSSPERLDSGDVNAQSDLWSLAVMLYEMVTGMQPYHAETTERLERMIRSRIPPPPAPDPCPDSLRRILMKSLANDPAVRYRSARDFANELILFRTGAFAQSSSAAEQPSAFTQPHQPAPAQPQQSAFPQAHQPAPPQAFVGRGFGPAAGLSPGASDDDTRRTTAASARLQPDDETRRTTAGRPADETTRSAASPPGQRFGTPKKRTVFSTFTRIVAILALLSILRGAWSIMSYMGRRDRADELARQIKSEQVTDPDQVFTRWSELAKTDPNSWAISAARHEVEKNLTDAANVTVARFRNDTQVIYEKDWQRAQTLLEHALQVDPDNETARGDLRLCEGQIARMEGVRHHDAQQLATAAERFNEAQKLLPHSPDPQLGLALLYIYGLKDVDKANAALQQAARSGYSIGNREKSELADGYRNRGDRLYSDSVNVRGLPQEKDQLSRAASDYNQALNLYQEIAPYGNAATNIRRVQQSIEGVTERLQEIQ